MSGKGGVGKSVVSQAIAHALATEAPQSRVLLVEIGDSSFAVDHLELHGVRPGHQPQPTKLGFDLAVWSGESCLREYVLHLLKLERLYQIFFENKVMRSLVNVAPGLNDVAILGKITSGLRRVGPPLKYDHIVVDCPSTGHAAALFRAPKGLAQAIQVGPMAHHSNEMVSLLNDPESSVLVTVTLPEEMPVVESLEFQRAMSQEFGFVQAAILNRKLEIPLSQTELKTVASEQADPLGRFAEDLAGIVQAQADLSAQYERGCESIGFDQHPLVFPQIYRASGQDLMQQLSRLIRGESQ